MYVSKHYYIDIAETYCREIDEQFGHAVFNDLLETIVDETEKTLHNAYDHAPSDEMYYVQYMVGFDGPKVPASELGSTPGSWWIGSQMLGRIGDHVDKLYGPVAFDCYEDSFEVME